MQAAAQKQFSIRVLGIDPAAAGATGYAVVDARGGCCASVRYDTIAAAHASMATSAHLRQIHTRIAELIEEFSPDCLALESIFAALNVGTALRLAEVRGVILLAAAQRDIPAHSYSPREVKAAIAGYGNADKVQLQHMVRAHLSLKEIPQPADASDALAVALCHIHNARNEAKFGEAAKLLAAPRSSRRKPAALPRILSVR
jgi:crossover junction endodeoxyribonuclease RuvC